MPGRSEVLEVRGKSYKVDVPEGRGQKLHELMYVHTTLRRPEKPS